MTPYLYANQNPNSPLRGNGLRFWGYPTRRFDVQIISIHTAENTDDDVGVDGGAEGVAGYLTRSTRPASYHELGDSDSYVVCLPYEATAFSVVGWNSRQWGWSFARRTTDWGRDKQRDMEFLQIAAVRVAKACIKFGIPARRITTTEANAGEKGLIAHGDLDPDRRTDPGAKFPWNTFIGLVQREVSRTVDPQEEEDMAVIAWAGGHAYHKSGVHAVHVLGDALTALRELGLREEQWASDGAFRDAHVILPGDTGPDPATKPATRKKAPAKARGKTDG